MSDEMNACWVVSPGGHGPGDEKVRAVKQTGIICMHLGKRLGKSCPLNERSNVNYVRLMLMGPSVAYGSLHCNG